MQNVRNKDKHLQPAMLAIQTVEKIADNDETTCIIM